MLIDVGPDRSVLAFDEPQWAVMPGQSAVFYDGGRVRRRGVINASRGDPASVRFYSQSLDYARLVTNA